MPQVQPYINVTRERITRLLNQVEDIQGQAAAIVQEWNKLGGATFFSGFTWAEDDITEQDFIDAIGSLGTLFPDILSTHGTNLYDASV